MFCRRAVAGIVRQGYRMPHSVLVDQAAALLGVSRRTVYYRIREGKLSTLRTRCGSQRILMASLERLLRESGREMVTPPANVAEVHHEMVRSPVSATRDAPPDPDDLTMVQDAGV